MKMSLELIGNLDAEVLAAESNLEEQLEELLIDIATTTVNLSPVDTGAYVTSHSFTTGAGRPRGKSSKNKPRFQNANAMRDTGLGNLISDIRRADLKNTTSITLRNNSPHASAVEDGGANWRRAGYKVFAQVRNIYG